MPSVTSYDVKRSSPIAVDACPVGGFYAKILEHNEENNVIYLTNRSFLEHSNTYHAETPVLIRYIINNRKEILMKYNAQPVLYKLRTNTHLYEIDGHIVMSREKKEAFI